jgi:uncharacterized membrane protein YjdF
MSAHLLIAIAGGIASIILAIVAKVPTYHVAPLFLIPIIFAVYAVRRRFHIHPLHYALFVSAVLLHNLGALGWYQKWPGGFSYDILVHFYFALVAGLIIFRAIRLALPALRPWHVYTATFFLIMGCGAVHEIIEYLSTLMLGKEYGMIKKTGYEFDTERDLLNNLLGVTLSLIVTAIVRTARRRDVPERHRDTAIPVDTPAPSY